MSLWPMSDWNFTYKKTCFKGGEEHSRATFRFSRFSRSVLRRSDVSSVVFLRKVPSHLIGEKLFRKRRSEQSLVTSGDSFIELFLYCNAVLLKIRFGVSIFSLGGFFRPIFFDVLFRRLITILWHNVARRFVFDLMLQNWISNRHSIPIFCYFCYNIQSRSFQRFIYT